MDNKKKRWPHLKTEKCFRQCFICVTFSHHQRNGKSSGIGQTSGLQADFAFSLFPRENGEKKGLNTDGCINLFTRHDTTQYN